MRKIKYSQAINEAFHQIMSRHDNVFQIGVGINTPWYVGQTMRGLIDTYGEERMYDTPVSENAIMGMAVGAAMTGMRPIITFPRMDFMYYAMDQICNHAALLSYMFGGRISMPLTIRAIINRGGEQAAQHSQAIQSLFMHIPGLKVVMPSNGYDAKGMLISAVEENNPVIYIDDRWLYDEESEVPEEYYSVSLSEAKCLHQGSDVTLVASSYMVKESKKAVEKAKQWGISVELIDLKSIKPLDIKLILNSIAKTGRLVIADGGWKTCGVAAEISAAVASEGFYLLKAPIQRVTLPDIPAPASIALEKKYYPTDCDIINSIFKIVLKSPKES
jgi:pyruvate dehydrogenase E1 component beta subunit